MSATRLNSPLSILLDKAIGIYEEMEKARLWGAGSILPTLVLGSKLNVLTNARDKMQKAKEQTDATLVGLIGELRDPDEPQTVGVAIPFDPALELEKLSKLGILIGILKLCAEFHAKVVTFEEVEQRLNLFQAPFVASFYASEFHANAATFVLRQQITFLQDDNKEKDLKIAVLEQAQTNSKPENTTITVQKRKPRVPATATHGFVTIVPNGSSKLPEPLSSALQKGIFSLWANPLQLLHTQQSTASASNDGDNQQRKSRTSMALGGYGDE